MVAAMMMPGGIGRWALIRDGGRPLRGGGGSVSTKLDDNLTIPLAVAAAVTLIATRVLVTLGGAKAQRQLGVPWVGP